MTDFQKRYSRVQHFLLQNGLDFLFIEDPIDIYYLTGLKLSKGWICIGQENVKVFVDSRYFEYVKQSSPFPVEKLGNKFLFDFVQKVALTKKTKIAFDSKKTVFCEFEMLFAFFKEAQKKHPKMEIDLLPYKEPLKEMQVIKQVEEIYALKRSANLNWKGFEYICSLLKPGVTEKFIALEYEIFCKKNGASSLAFDPIICFGTNSAYPHHRPSKTELKENDAVLIDIGTMLDGYASDMTRMIFLGKADPYFQKTYSLVRMAHGKALSLCRPGMKIGDIDRAVRELFATYNVDKEFIHSLGHGIGLRVHEYPLVKWDGLDKDLILKAGMVFTIEPGLYRVKSGGVRYEDTVLITPSGYENFYMS